MVYMDISWMALVNVLDVSIRFMHIAWITMCVQYELTWFTWIFHGNL